MDWQERYLARYYDRSAGWVDGTAEFHALCASAIPSRATILEIGSGASNPTSRFLATLGELHGVDPDAVVLSNDALTHAAVMTGGRIPYPDRCFDVAVSNYVAEHVEDPELHLSEVGRVLKDGAAYVLRTPNRFHYVALVARITPHRVHTWLSNPLRGRTSADHEVYPTWYRMNSGKDIARIAASSGFCVETLHRVEKEPSYGMASRLLFLTFLAYERLVNSSDVLAFARANLFVVLRKV